MKKLLLSIITIVSLAFAVHAVTYMRVLTNDGQIVMYDVEAVTEVDFVEDTDNPSPNVGDSVSVNGQIGGKTYVDLGLPSGLKWATCNLGATSYAQYGDYFAWGETTIWQEYTLDNYDYDKAYCDANNVLYPKYDAATSNWGDYWRMPTYAEFKELLDNCSWKYYSDYKNSGVAGFEGCSKKNGNRIFLSAAGYMSPSGDKNVGSKYEGYYRASDFSGYPKDKQVYGVHFASNPFDYGRDFQFRYVGHSIRPVTTLKQIELERVIIIDEYETAKQGISVNGIVGNHTYVDLGFPSGKKWATYNIGAASPEQYGYYYAWGETSPKLKYTLENYKYFIGYDELTNMPQLSKYVRFQKHGLFDNKSSLDSEDDAAVINWGDGWHMPSMEDYIELIEGCQWKRVDNLNNSTVVGWVGFSRYNNMKIYFPAGGFKYGEHPDSEFLNYLSSDLPYDYTGKVSTDYKAAVFSRLNDVIQMVDYDRYYGFLVRAVHD